LIEINEEEFPTFSFFHQIYPTIFMAFICCLKNGPNNFTYRFFLL